MKTDGTIGTGGGPPPTGHARWGLGRRRCHACARFFRGSEGSLLAVDAPAARQFYCRGCLPVVRERALQKVPWPGHRARAAALIAHGGQRPVFREPGGVCYASPDRGDVDA